MSSRISQSLVAEASHACSQMLNAGIFYAHEIRFLRNVAEGVTKKIALSRGQRQWLGDLTERALRYSLKRSKRLTTRARNALSSTFSAELPDVGAQSRG